MLNSSELPVLGFFITPEIAFGLVYILFYPQVSAWKPFRSPSDLETDAQPPSCVLDAFTNAIEACDQLDSVKDGIIAFPGQCHFKPHPWRPQGPM